LKFYKERWAFAHLSYFIKVQYFVGVFIIKKNPDQNSRECFAKMKGFIL